MMIKIKYRINERYIMKKEDKLLQKQNDRCIHSKEMIRSYNELGNWLKSMGEKISINGSENK